MNFSKTLFLVLFVIGSLFENRALADASWIQQIQPLADAQLIETPDGNHDLVIQSINSAKSSIEMWMYHLTDANIIQALIQAQARGVSVQVILDHASIKNAKYKSVLEQLQAGSVAAVESTTQFNLTHTKTFVIDRNLAFVSTMNLVGHFQDMLDFGLFTQDQGIIQELETVFATDLTNAQNNTADTPELSDANLIWSPTNSEQKLADLIDSAQTSLEITVENLGQTNVLEAMVRAQSRGVNVQIIVPKCDLNPNPVFNYPYLYTLDKAGVSVHVMPGPSSPTTPYVHAKTIIVDGHMAYLGSENFSQNSLRNSRETGVVFANLSGIQFMDSIFQKLWQAAEPLPATTPTCPKAY